MLHQFVLCDLGGVVVEVESDRLMHQVSQLTGKPFEEVQQSVYDEKLLLPFELGRISAKEYFEGLKKSLALRWTYEQFSRAWTEIFRENIETTAILKRLKNRHRLFALTNTNILHLDYIKRNVPSLQVFDGWIASCDVGLRKPDPEMYRHALAHTGARAEQTIYIDDRPEMVEAGKGAGLIAIRFQSGKQLEQDLQSIGLNL